jgi:hypothetical protein
MTHLTLPSGDWLIVKTPEHTGNITVRATESLDYGSVSCYDKFTNKETTLLIPKGHWQLYGADPLRLTEEECRWIVELLYFKQPSSHEEMNIPYKNYLWLTNEKEGAGKPTATESYSSLLTANGHKQGECVILKKK